MHRKSGRMEKAADPQVIIFDCDGVLIDSELVVCGINARALTKLGYPIDVDGVLRRFAGRPDKEMRTEVEAELGRSLPADYAAQVDAQVVAAYERELRAVPGVAAVLAQLRLPFCVASSSYPGKLRLGLEVTGLYERFAPNIISASVVASGKPAPDVFVYAAGWMRTAVERCLVVEDSVAGVTAAKRAGMRVFGFTGGTHCGPGHAAVLRAAGAERTFADMHDLPRLITT